MSKIFTGKTLFPRRHAATLRELLEHSAEDFGSIDAYIYRKKIRGEDFHVSYQQLHDDVLAFATGLLSLGCPAGDTRIAVIGENSYPWVLAFNAAVSGLGQAVPLDHQLPDEEALSLLERSKVQVLAFSRRHLSLAEAAARSCPGVKLFVCLSQDEEELPACEKHIGVDELLQKGRTLLKAGDTRMETLRPKPEDLASIVFTSGTTSASKGVMLSQKNIVSNACSCAESFDVKPGERALSVLPLHHTFENTVGMFAFWFLGMTICINDGLRYVADNLKNWEIGIMMSVPLLIENIYSQIMRSIRKQNGEAKLERGIALAHFLRLFRLDKRRFIFNAIHKQLGGKLHLCVIGAAAVDPKVCDFFAEIGIDCLPGYGLSEASPVLACNVQKKLYPETVGWPIPGVELRIDDSDSTTDSGGFVTGEILARGDNVMMGYLDAPELSAEAIDKEGWLHTGDIGYFDQAHALHITGRKKTMLVLANGKKAFPEEIEQLLKEIPGVDEAFVWDETNGRGNVMICAKLKLKREEVPVPKTGDDEDISQWLRRQVTEVNHAMPVYKSINAFIWTEEPLEMTTTLKIRRPAERERIRRDLEERGLTIQDADGLRIPEAAPIQIVIEK